MKLLKTLVVVLSILSAVSLTLGVMLFQKREILKGRTLKLETALIALSSTIEDGWPSVDTVPRYPSRDIESTTSRQIFDPEVSSFWQSYPHELDLYGDRMLDISQDRVQLASFYRRDEVTQKPLKDPQTGEKLTDGPGTMQELLNRVLAKASAQLDLLNATRDHVVVVRGELVKTIVDLNSKKQRLRMVLKTVDDRDMMIAGLKHEIITRDQKIGEHEQRIAQLTEDITESERTVAFRDETVDERDAMIVRLRKIIEGKDDDFSRMWTSLTSGDKGSIASVDEEWQFVILDLNDEFVKKYAAALASRQRRPEPAFDLIRKVDGKDVYVARVKLDGVEPGKNRGVATILPLWQQMAIRAGDRVVYF